MELLWDAKTLDPLISALCVGLSTHVRPTPHSPVPYLVRQSECSLVSTLFSARQLSESQAYCLEHLRACLNTSEPAFYPSRRDPGKPTSSAPLNLRPSFLLSVVRDKTRTHEADECLPALPLCGCQALCFFITSGLSWELTVVSSGSCWSTDHPFTASSAMSHYGLSLGVLPHASLFCI